MGVLTRTRTDWTPDFHHYRPEYNDDGTEKHIVCDGARFHVLSWSQRGARCSEPNCEINRHLPPNAELSRAEIETVLRRYGASHFGYASAPDKAVIGFQASDRRVKFVVPMPDPQAREFTHTAARGTRREPKAAYDEWEKACRQRWRALALCIKAKLEAVECGITTFESEFLAHIVLPNGETMADRALPYIAEAYATNNTPPMISFDG